MSDSPYGEQDYSIKPSSNKIHLDDPAEEFMRGQKELEERNALIAQEGTIIGTDDEKKQTTEEILRERALKLNPKHGDKLYPLEVLGVYDMVLKDQHSAAFGLVGMPETYIDDTLKSWIVTIDRQRFLNRLERVLDQDEVVRTTFLLRLNYAFLMEETEDKIEIHRGRQAKLLFGETDVEGNYIGDLESAADLSDEDLDKRANDFYTDKEKIFGKLVGTPMPVRQKINQCLNMMGYDIEDNLDVVYHDLRDANKKHYEGGLIARMAYLVFLSESAPSDPLFLE